MRPLFFEEIYCAWKERQVQKYGMLLPLLEEHVPQQEASVLDVGIGKAWLEEFMLENGFSFSLVTGVDVSEGAVSPRTPFVDYLILPSCLPQKKFDFVVCFDSAHLLEGQGPWERASPGGTILLSAPLSQKHRVPFPKKARVVAEGVVGEEEESFFRLLKKT